MSYNFVSDAPLRTIKRIVFGVLSPEEIKAHSMVHVEHVELYENKGAKSGGLADPRMGSTDKRLRCQTCGETIRNCPGHFGHIELATPVFHVGFLKDVKKILECVCFSCSRYRLLPSHEKYKKLLRMRDRFNYAWSVAKNKSSCDYEDCNQPIYPLRKVGLGFFLDPKKVKRRATKIQLTAEDALKILSKISDDTCRLIGLNPKFARPEWMIIRYLPVPPPAVRPSVTMDSNGKGEDDLTHKLADIIRTNQLYQKAENYRTQSEYRDQLLFHVTTYIDNEVSGVPPALQKGNRPLKSIRARLKGKEGRLRGNLMGKRVDFAARTVITGDPNLSIEEVGVPYAIAESIPVPEKVCDYNRYKLQLLVDKSPTYPSATYVVRANGRRIDLRYAPEKPLIQVGDTVERHVVDGDIVVFNRQPSLHKMSMMGHRVRVMSHSTFRMSLSATIPYNADFDGDEMNCHFPQSKTTIAEIENLAMVSQLIVSPQANKPVIGIVQDVLCGVRMFTKRDNLMGRDLVMNLVMSVPNWDGRLPVPCVLKPRPLWSGKQLLSLLLPEELNHVGYSSDHPDDETDPNTYGDTRVLVRKGQLLSGIICKRTVGTSQGGLIHVMWKDYGPIKTRDFIDGCQYVINNWLAQVGFSVGLGDALVDAETTDAIDTVVNANLLQVKDVLAKFGTGNLTRQGNLTLDQTKESMVLKSLNKARDQSGKLVSQHLHDSNNIKQMVAAGSKGSNLNICQISACVGQQHVEGKRIPFGFNHYRTLPHFRPGDDSPESRGFVQNSFIRGLTPSELFFHAMGGREGLIDTAVKTAETGYFQRRLVKALEDIRIAYDGTVRDARGNIQQFCYGEDALDGTAVEKQTLQTLTIDDERFRREHVNESCPEEAELVTSDREFLRKVFKTAETGWPLPVNLSRLVQVAKDKHFPTKTTLEPSYVYEKLKAVREAKWTTSMDPDPALLFKIHCTSFFCSKQSIYRHRLTKEQFDWAMKEVSKKYRASLAHPGEMVGVLTAQSIGEPATQMTLNTFHLSGTANKTVTSGIPRLKELINAAKNLKTPSMTIYLTEDRRFSYEEAVRLRIRLEHTTLQDVLSGSWSLLKENELKEPWLTIQDAIPDDARPQKLQPWVARMVVSKDDMQKRDLLMKDLKQAIEWHFQDDVYVQCSDDNWAELVLLLRLRKEEEADYDAAVFSELVDEIVKNLTVCGVQGIEKAFVTEKKCFVHDEQGALVARNEYVVETDGINVREAMYNPSVDVDRTYCNDPQEMFNVYGAEAARGCLLYEIRSVIETDGSYVNFRHLSLLCDVMTNRGNIMAITRHGINNVDVGPLKKCTFEQTVDILTEAAVNGQVDEICGVAENIITGQLAPLGTGTFDMLLDEPAMNRIVKRQVVEKQVFDPSRPSYLQ